MTSQPQLKKVASNTPQEDWSPSSWRDKPIKQVPKYKDQDKLAGVRGQLASYPPLIFAGEARHLKRELAAISKGEGFLFHGGDCAESFADFSSTNVRDTFRVLLQIAVILTFAGKKSITKIGRMAGQFAKPRSNPMETIDGVELPSYRGDIINGIDFTADSREPDPDRILRAYFQSAATMNLLRAFASGGYADLNKAHNWLLDFAENAPQAAQYEDLLSRIGDSLSFMEACGINSKNVAAVRETHLYTSHEALLLEYEEPFARHDSTTDIPYATSAHFLWIGDRTRQPDGAHVEFLRGVDNPIGLKCGPSLSNEDMAQLIETLNPENEAGRLTLITRMGAGKVGDELPRLIKVVKENGFNVVWCCDPMHGNTHTADSGYKTRAVADITSEIADFFRVCRAEGAYPGGVHLEMTGRNVTECIGGSQNLTSADLSRDYNTLCDPRLNASQSMELAFEVAKLLAEEV